MRRVAWEAQAHKPPSALRPRLTTPTSAQTPAGKVQEEILHRQATLTDTASRLLALHHGVYPDPLYTIPIALDALFRKGRNTLPRCIDGLGGPRRAPEGEGAAAAEIGRLDAAVCAALVWARRPARMAAEVRPGTGCATLRVRGEYEVDVTLSPERTAAAEPAAPGALGVPPALERKWVVREKQRPAALGPALSPAPPAMSIRHVRCRSVPLDTLTDYPPDTGDGAADPPEGSRRGAPGGPPLRRDPAAAAEGL